MSMLTTYVVRKDGKLVEYAHTLLCLNKSNPFVALICPTPINNPDVLLNTQDVSVSIRQYENYNDKYGTVTYTVTERTFKGF